jgi:hypothetical protein
VAGRSKRFLASLSRSTAQFFDVSAAACVFTNGRLNASAPDAVRDLADRAVTVPDAGV